MSLLEEKKNTSTTNNQYMTLKKSSGDFKFGHKKCP